MIKRVAQHTMQSDDGRTYIVHEYQEFIYAGTKDAGDARIPGMKYFELRDGSKVNYVDEHTFEIVQSGVRLRRV